MNRPKVALYLLTALLGASGCAYTNIRLPLDTDVWETKLGTKEGKASTYTLLWLVAWGDAGVKTAAENGGITVVHHMDVGIKSYAFGVYSQRETVVYGD
jgi:hypothetical protein